MPKQFKLSGSHKRSLSVTTKAVEKTINEMQHLLKDKNQNQIAEIIVPVYSDNEKENIIKILDELREINEDMFESLNLKSQKLYEDRIMSANLTYLWTILIDSRSDKLKRYGNVEKENAEIIDSYMNNLLSIIEKLKQYCSKKSDN